MPIIEKIAIRTLFPLNGDMSNVSPIYVQGKYVLLYIFEQSTSQFTKIVTSTSSTLIQKL